MTYDILATGSSGNAVVINGEILIDCGIPMKKLRESGYIKSLNLVLLTHSHGDHFNPATVRALHQERPALRWVCCEWMVPHLLEAGVDRLSIDVTRPTEPGESSRALIYNNFAIVDPVHLVHDVPNCGWMIHKNHERLLYVTDTSTLDHIEAKNYDYYLIEANHTRAEIEARIEDKLARGEFAYEVRAARNHLSQEQANEWLARNAGPNSKYVFLHQHREEERRGIKMAEYIEREEALEALLYEMCGTGYQTTAMMAVRRIPAADVSPVVHGRWEVSDTPCERFKCSECGGGCWYYDYQGDVAKSRYCPSCGAKMDKEDADRIEGT